MISNSESSAPGPSCVDSRVLTEVRLNASALFPNALYVSLDISSLRSDISEPELCSSISPSLLSRVVAGFNSRVRALVDSGSSHCFVSLKVCESNAFSTYTVDPVRVWYLDGSSSIINRMLRLLLRFPSGEVQYMNFFVTRLDSLCDLGSAALIR